MKRTVMVTITKEFEIEIPDDRLTPEALAEFSAYMFDVDDPNEMFHLAAEQVGNYGEVYVEGLGQLGEEYMRGRPGYENMIVYRETFAETESEIVS
jgi:hypothetical protein